MGFTGWSHPPVSDCEAHSMPTHNSLGPDNRYGVKDARKATIALSSNRV